MKKSFTLAETLITLTIIGIIAAITVPTLYSKYQEKVLVTQLKEAYTIFNNAYRLAIREYGTPEDWDIKGYTSQEGADALMQYMTKYMKVKRFCPGRGGDCWYTCLKGFDGKTCQRNINAYGGYSKAVLDNGMLIHDWVWSAECKGNFGFANSTTLNRVCGELGVDVNGLKGPNSFGRDVFYFFVTADGVIPYGTPDMLATHPFGFIGGCRDKTKNAISGYDNNGKGCAGWVLYEENMDYLKCDTLTWTNKKCE